MDEFEKFAEKTRTTPLSMNRHLLFEGIVLYVRYWLKRFGF